MWIVSNEQLLAWVQNPVPVSQLGNVDALKCATPQVDSSKKICNGIPQNEAGLLSECPFPDFPFYTCVSYPLTKFTNSKILIFFGLDSTVAHSKHQHPPIQTHLNPQQTGPHPVTDSPQIVPHPSGTPSQANASVHQVHAPSRTTRDRSDRMERT